MCKKLFYGKRNVRYENKHGLGVFKDLLNLQSPCIVRTEISLQSCIQPSISLQEQEGWFLVRRGCMELRQKQPLPLLSQPPKRGEAPRGWKEKDGRHQRLDYSLFDQAKRKGGKRIIIVRISLEMREARPKKEDFCFSDIPTASCHLVSHVFASFKDAQKVSRSQNGAFCAVNPSLLSSPYSNLLLVCVPINFPFLPYYEGCPPLPRPTANRCLSGNFLSSPSLFSAFA